MKKYLIAVLIISLFASCGGDNTTVSKTEIITDTTAIENNLTPKRAGKAQMVFQTIPSPFETATIFEEAGAGYDPELTNSIDFVSNYTTSSQQALNLGVYGADLSYANIFDQSQESMFYMNCTKILADGLGVAAAFSPETIERIEENINNRDSMMIIVNDAFWTCDAYLKENGQNDLSALIIVGGWVEGLYLGSNSLNNKSPNEELMSKIADQKYSLDNLLDLLSTYDNEEVNSLKDQLNALKIVFDKVKEGEGATTVSNDETPVIGGATLNYSKETIFEIADQAKAIRNEIIK